MAAKTDSSSSNIVSTRTPICGLSATIRRVASMAFAFGGASAAYSDYNLRPSAEASISRASRLERVSSRLAFMTR